MYQGLKHTEYERVLLLYIVVGWWLQIKLGHVVDETDSPNTTSTQAKKSQHTHTSAPASSSLLPADEGAKHC